MKAMILAAGLGKRLRPLTESIPKPLIQVGPNRLIEKHLYALAKAGISDVVVNYSYQGHLFKECLGDGEAYGVKIHYSEEPEGGLETGGGLLKALPFFADEPFMVVNGDILTDYTFEALKAPAFADAHVVLIPNPEHNPKGDFSAKRLGLEDTEGHFTYSGMGVFTSAFFKGAVEKRFPLRPFLEKAAEEGRLSGEIYRGFWSDIGTPERLEYARNKASN